jgi:nucleoside-triphosphatase
LTGEIQIGKSTAINRWLQQHSGMKLGGFRTIASPKNADGSDGIHIVPASGNTEFTEENRVLWRSGEYNSRELKTFPEIFDTVGVSLLKNSDGSDLILMDEIGFSEDKAEKFHAAVLERLDGDIPVLGVVGIHHEYQGILIGKIKAHPKVRVITVTKENRDTIPEEINKWIS